MKNITNHTSESQAITPPLQVPEVMSWFELIINQQQQLQQYQKQLETQQQQLKEPQQQLDALTGELSQIKNPTAQPKTSKPRANYRNTLAKLTKRLAGISGSAKYQPRFALQQILFSYIGSFIGIAALAYLTADSGYPLIAAPFGAAAAVLLFAAPDSPLAQPRNCIVGNFLGGLVSLIMVHLFGL